MIVSCHGVKDIEFFVLNLFRSKKIIHGLIVSIILAFKKVVNMKLIDFLSLPKLKILEFDVSVHESFIM